MFYIDCWKVCDILKVYNYYLPWLFSHQNELSQISGQRQQRQILTVIVLTTKQMCVKEHEYPHNRLSDSMSFRQICRGPNSRNTCCWKDCCFIIPKSHLGILGYWDPPSLSPPTIPVYGTPSALRALWVELLTWPLRWRRVEVFIGK